MSNPDVVFARFVAANPAPDPNPVPGTLPSADVILDSIHRPRRGRVEPGPGRRRRGWALALVSFLVVVSVGVGLNWLRGEPDSDATLNASETTKRDAVSTAERWLDAVNRGDIDTAMELSAPATNTLADRRVNEWLAGFAAHGMPTRVITCQVVEASVDRASVECQIRLSDPVSVETGQSELVAPFLFEDGLVAWQPYRGGDISQVNAAYSDYLRQFHATDYERVCAPDAYESGSVVQDRLLALTGECAELAAPLADEVAQWIRDGRPLPQG